jgi:Ctr copper transporter family
MSCRAVEGLAGPSLAQRHRKVAERVADVLMRRSGGMAAHALYGVNAATSYLLMLAAMTFNVGVFVAVCSGVAPPHACAGADLQCATRAVQSRESIEASPTVHESIGGAACISRSRNFCDTQPTLGHRMVASEPPPRRWRGVFAVSNPRTLSIHMHYWAGAFGGLSFTCWEARLGGRRC